MDLAPHLLELIRLASTSLPEDVEAALASALQKEEASTAARGAIQAILENVRIARAESVPLCQDTGTPVFYVRHSAGTSALQLEELIHAAVAEATAKAWLRPNAVDNFSGHNSGSNLGGRYFPYIHFEEVMGEALTVDLLLKGGGSENVGRQYALPDAQLGAGRDLEGVRRAALDAIFLAQGQGCPPGFLGIAVGGDRGTAYLASKELFFEPVGSRHPDADIAALEERITREANALGIGPMGFGGRAAILGTRITGLHRLPASYFVTISFMCWAFRRKRLTVLGEHADIR